MKLSIVLVFVAYLLGYASASQLAISGSTSTGSAIFVIDTDGGSVTPVFETTSQISGFSALNDMIYFTTTDSKAIFLLNPSTGQASILSSGTGQVVAIGGAMTTDSGHNNLILLGDYDQEPGIIGFGASNLLSFLIIGIDPSSPPAAIGVTDVSNAIYYVSSNLSELLVAPLAGGPGAGVVASGLNLAPTLAQAFHVMFMVELTAKSAELSYYSIDYHTVVPLGPLPSPAENYAVVYDSTLLSVFALVFGSGGNAELYVADVQNLQYANFTMVMPIDTSDTTLLNQIALLVG